MPKRRNTARQGAHSRLLVRGQEWTLALAVLAACAGFFVLRERSAAPGASARVTLGSKQILEIPLREEDDYRIDLEKDYGVPVSFEVKGGAVRFVDVTCPDHICEKTGFVSADGQTAVCMPNRVAVLVVAE